ncbi:glycosyltransferase family 4 protein [Ornithinimicrobium sp. LYQ121]|uniref:glycosyltransferase family 4 protein n=1 Tax=Ornithinimicrobium sp. LYQ121 TaxID=3378801 RepID=UPI003853D4F2
MPAEPQTPTDPSTATPTDGRRVAYVVKVYPRFSETFVVTEILAREAAGEDLAVYALRPTTDARFHPQLAQVRAPVTHLPRHHRLTTEWELFARAERELPGFGARLGALMPVLARLDPGDVAQAVDLALRLRRDGITHVHVHFANLAARCAAVASALTGIPYTVTTHAKDLFHEDVDPVLLREVLGRAQHVVAISDFNRRFLLSEVDPGLDGSVRLVRNGLELDRFPYRAPAAPRTPLRVLAVGRLVEKKGFAHLVRAAGLLHEQGMALHARIVGDGDLADPLAEQVSRLGLSGSVELLGPRSQAELIEELAWADVLVAPCVVGADGNADGLPTVLLEAMASGVPCIATDVTGIPEAVHPGTGILLSQDPTDLAERLADALREVADPAWPRVEVARAARAAVERDFDAAVQSRRLAELEGAPVVDRSPELEAVR